MPTADYVIVGAGSAGCVLANRLTEDPSVNVTLLEAGAKDRSPNIKIPAAFPKQFKTKLDWDFSTDPEPHCDGRSTFRALRRADPEAKVLVTSGDADAASTFPAFCEGLRFLPKPFDTAQLLRSLHELLHGAESETDSTAEPLACAA